MFDRIVVVDWSASAKATTKESDAIWIADVDVRSRARTERPSPARFANPKTREDAMVLLRTIVAQLTVNERVLIGFDFAFGYPADAGSLPGGGRWANVWNHLENSVRDGADNSNNRFEVAEELNERFAPPGPFWGHPQGWQSARNGLGPTKPAYAGRERRHVEDLVPRAQSVWKLAYPGSVGSQALTGIARLQALRSELGLDRVQVWPFETKFADEVSAQVILAEVYPSLWPIKAGSGEIKDRAQVRVLAEGFAEQCRSGNARRLLDGPRRQPEGVREAALSHEGWMVGFGDEPVGL